MYTNGAIDMKVDILASQMYYFHYLIMSKTFHPVFITETGSKMAEPEPAFGVRPTTVKSALNSEVARLHEANLKI